MQRKNDPTSLRRASSIAVAFVCFLCLFFAPVGARAEALPASISAGVDHLMGLGQGESTFDPEAVAPLIAYVASEKPQDAGLHAGEWQGMPSGYFEFDLSRDLQTVLRYAYHPGIPNNVFRPTSIRLTQWLEVDGKENTSLPMLWTHLASLDSPLVVTGVEHEESTPELTTGACYGYMLDRALILFRLGEQNVFISVSKQRETSDKGKKGACLGGDKNWDYVYTGEDGLTRAGLGWADTHIYESASIAVFYESDPAHHRVRCGVFKWIRAGWAGFNMVEPRHIRQGIERYVQGFRETLEHPRLPEPERLVCLFDWVRGLPRKALSAKVNDYLQGLEMRYADEKVLSKPCFEALIEQGDYAGRMNRVQMESLVALESMKWALGRHTVLGEAFGLAPDPRVRRVSQKSSLPCRLN